MAQIKELTEIEFEQFTKTFPNHSFYQTIEYAKTMEKQGLQYMLLGFLEEHILAASLILIQKKKGFKYAYAPRGFLIDYENYELVKEFTLLLKKYLGKKDIVAIRFNPYIIKTIYDKNHYIKEENEKYEEIYSNLKKLGYYHFGYNAFFESFKPRFEAILPLHYSISQLFFGISKSFQTKIRSAEKRGIQIYRGNIHHLDTLYFQTKNKYPRDLKFFQDLYQQFGSKIEFYYAKLDTKEFLKQVQKSYQEAEQNCISINQEIFHKIGKNHKLIDKKIEYDKTLNQEQNRLVYATNLLRDFPNGIIVASALIIKDRNDIYLFMDGHDPVYKNLNGKHLLLWKLMIKYQQLGYQQFNLGGMTDLHVEKNPYQGLNQFKLNFGSDVYEYMGDLELITNPTLYFMYRNMIRNPLKNR